jgi:hypothetical protein
MKLARFVCLFMLFAVPLLGQSKPAAQSHQPRSSTVARRTPPQTSGLSFDPAVAYGSGGYILTSMAVADVNGDGKLDVLLANQCSSDISCANGTVSVLLGNGDGTFQTAVTYGSGGTNALAIAVGDVNRDGKLDLVVANQCVNTNNCDNSTVGVLLGNGDGTFGTAVAYNSGAWDAESVAVADVNGDGKLDLVVTHNCATSTVCVDGVVGVLLGNGDGTFQAAVNYDSGGVGARGVAVGDVNGDGKPDLLVASYCLPNPQGCVNTEDGAVGVLLSNGDGTFQPPVVYDSGANGGFAIAVADVNGDGKLDVLISNELSNNVAVLLGNGNGTFETAKTYGSGGQYPNSVVVADVNGDGKPDLVVVNLYCCGTSTDAYVGVLLGNGDGTFQTAVSYGTAGFFARSVAAGDLNRDGKADLLVANQCPVSTCPNGVVGVLINSAPTITTTSLVSSLNPSNFGQSVSLTATTIPQGQGVPTGTVNFLDGSKSLGIVRINASGTATLTTAALAVGTHKITAAYSGDANFAASTSPIVSQVVQGAVVKLNPTSINFGNMTIGLQIKQAILVNLTNTGNTTLTISSVAITGTNSSDYFVENGCPSTVAAGFGCTMSVGFTPTTLGTRTASVSITDNAANSPQTIPLTGVGVQPAVSLSSTSLTFPTQVVFTNSKAQTVTVTNTGVGILSITNIALTGPFTQTNTCGSNVNAGSTCTLTVIFRPTTAGSITGSLSLTDNAPDSPQTINLKGTGTYILFNPSTFNFGNQPVGTKSLPKKITLSNKGSVAVSITKISLIGANAGDFAETNTCGNSVAAGASCFITVTFTPSAAGKRTANVSVIDNGGGSPQTVSLTGTGT